MDNSDLRRIITLIDMDCFYCQVELRLNPELAGKPVAVVQYNQWKQGGIIAVNYEARDLGVKRFMRGEEAKKICPELNLPSVPCVRGKADLTRYREAGAEVAEVFASFSDCVERASIDEAFIDLTSVVDAKIRAGNVDLTPDKLPSTFVLGYSDLKTNNQEERLKGTTEWIQMLEQNSDHRNSEYRLAVGAVVVEQIRSQVLKKTGFHCSAGIAHNKILAKLAAGMHKPKCQTVIPHGNVPELYDSLPLSKIRSLGGKFGKSVAQTLGISSMLELYNFSKEHLIEKFNVKNGTWLYDIARGIDYDPVTSRLVPESIGCSKNFRGRMAIKSKDNLYHWLSEMASEVVERLEKDQAVNMRKAKLLTVSFKMGGSSGSRSCPLSSYNADVIAKDAFEVLSKFHQTPADFQVWDPPIENLGLSASKFVCVKTSIKNYLKEKSRIETHQISNIQKVSEPEKSTIKEEFNRTENLTPIGNVLCMDTSQQDIFDEFEDREAAEHRVNDLFGKTEAQVCMVPNESENGEVREEVSYYGETNESAVELNRNKIEKFIAKEMEHDENKEMKEYGDSNVSKKPEKRPVKSFFVKMLAHKKLQEPKLNKAATEEVNPVPSTSHQVTEYVEDDFLQLCPACKKKVHLSVYVEHMDFHAAVDLDKAINKIHVKTAPPNKSPSKKKGSPARKRRKIVPPVDQKVITTFFAVLPK